MKKYLLISIIVFLTTVSPALSAEQIEIKGLNTTHSGDPLILPATLTKPTGEAPFPAVIMLHSCEKDNQYLNPWEERFVNWGYVVLRVDILTPRKRESLCISPWAKFDQAIAQDAYDAKSYLMGLPSINKDKIAVVGWGLSGASCLIAIDENSKIKNRDIPFRAAVAFYPFPVHDIEDQNAPLLVLIGEKDARASLVALRTILSLSKSPYETKLKTYENATHYFDWEGYSVELDGVRKQGYDPVSAKAAILEVEKFLAKYLK